MAKQPPQYAGAASTEPLREAVEPLVSSGTISPEEAELAAEHAAKVHVTIEDAAVELGLVKPGDLARAIATQGRALPSLADISDDSLFTVVRPESHETGEIRALRNSLTLRWARDAKLRALSILSPNREDGRSVAAANLAISFAQIGVKTLLVDADLRNARQHSLFGIENRLGLSNFLAGGGKIGLQEVPHLEALSIVSSGSLSLNPYDVLHRTALQSFFEAVPGDFQMIIVDTPAAKLAADYQLIASVTGASLLVGREKKTRIRDLSKMLGTLKDLNVQVLGGTMTREARA